MERAAEREWWENPGRWWYQTLGVVGRHEKWLCGWCFGPTADDAASNAMKWIRVDWPRAFGNVQITIRRDVRGGEQEVHTVNFGEEK